MSLPEWATRKLLINKALNEAGWTPIVPHDDHTPRDLVVFEEYPTAAARLTMPYSMTASPSPR